MVTKQESAATTTASAPPLTLLSAPALGRSEKQLAAVESTSDHPAKRAEPGEVRTSVCVCVREVCLQARERTTIFSASRGFGTQLKHHCYSYYYCYYTASCRSR